MPIYNNQGALVTPPGQAGLPAFAVDPQNSGTIYLGLQGRIFKTADGGASWKDSSAGLPPVTPDYPGILFLLVDPQNTAAIYALIRQNYPNFPAPIVLAASTDGGASWQTATDPNLAAITIPLAPDLNLFNILTPDPRDPSTLYLGTSFGVLKTADGGGHWNFADSGFKAIGLLGVAVDSENTSPENVALLANVSWGGWIKSTNQGANWSAIGSWPGSTTGNLRYCCYPVADPQTPDTLYALCGSSKLSPEARCEVTTADDHSGLGRCDAGNASNHVQFSSDD